MVQLHPAREQPMIQSSLVRSESESMQRRSEVHTGIFVEGVLLNLRPTSRSRSLPLSLLPDYSLAIVQTRHENMACPLDLFLVYFLWLSLPRFIPAVAVRPSLPLPDSLG